MSKPTEANADLIAAAPEMLEVLERVLAWADTASPTFAQDSMAAIVDQIKAAIAKAKGEV